MVFYPDNAKRASRLQQLVDSMAGMQTDIQRDADTMDAKNKAIRPQIDKLLKQNGYLSMDDLIAKSTALLTPDQRKVWEAMIAAAQSSKAGFDWTYFAAGLLMLPEGVILTGKMVLNIGKFCMNTTLVKTVASLFKSGAQEGAGAANEIAEAADVVADKSSKEISEVAEVADVAEEAAEAVSMLSKLATFFKVLGGIGFVVTLVVGIVEIVEGAEQKTELVNAIHTCQPSRLTIKYYKVQADNILQNLTTMGLYLDALVGTDKKKPNPAAAAYLADGIMQSISDLDAAIDWAELEKELETQDRSSGLFYGDEDLSSANVISIAKGKAAPPPPIYNPPTTAAANLKTAAPLKAVAVPHLAAQQPLTAAHHQTHHHG